jgi:hypothetical protein
MKQYNLKGSDSGVKKTQNLWVSALCPLSVFLNNLKTQLEFKGF